MGEARFIKRRCWFPQETRSPHFMDRIPRWMWIGLLVAWTVLCVIGALAWLRADVNIPLELMHLKIMLPFFSGVPTCFLVVQIFKRLPLD